MAATVTETIAFALEIVEREVAHEGAEFAAEITAREIELKLAKHTVAELEAFLIEHVGRRASGRVRRAEVLAEVVEIFADAHVPA